MEETSSIQWHTWCSVRVALPHLLSGFIFILLLHYFAHVHAAIYILAISRLGLFNFKVNLDHVAF